MVATRLFSAITSGEQKTLPMWKETPLTLKTPLSPLCNGVFIELRQKKKCAFRFGEWRSSFIKPFQNPLKCSTKNGCPVFKTAVISCYYASIFIITLSPHFSSHVIVKSHLWICLFIWVTSICFPALVIHWWDPFKMELKNWQILSMFHLKELWSSFFFFFQRSQPSTVSAGWLL